MSDPVTNMQIEDVLSSIRKLVSEEVRAQARPSGNGAPRKGAPEKDMLILTPAHRVSEETPDLDEGPDLTALGDSAGDQFDLESFSRGLAEDDGDPDTAEEDYLSSDDSEAGSGDLVAEYDDEGAAAPLDLSGLIGGTREDRPQARGPEGSHDDGPMRRALDRSDAVIPSFLRSRGVKSLDDRLAGLETGPTSAGYGADRLDLDHVTDPIPEEAEDWAEEEEPVGGSLSDTDMLEGPRENSGGAPHAGAPEEAVAWEDHTDASEVDTDVRDPGRAEPVAPDAPIEGKLLADTAATSDDRMLSAEPSMIDEEALRDLVSEIVRQELQGALGERITRNVRKLVRREIQRALTAHDLL